MHTPEKYFVTYNRERERYFITPYRNSAEAWSAGSPIKEFSPGHPGFEDCVQICAGDPPGTGVGDAGNRQAGRVAAIVPVDPEAVAKRKFEGSPALKAEFGAFETYWAYIRASDAGLTRISTGKGVVV